MKLAEALIRRADIQRRVEHLRERLKLSVLVQEGDRPPEEPKVLLEELDRLLNQLARLISQINHTNGRTTLKNGMVLTDALAQRDVLKLRHSVLKSVADVASRRATQYSRSEIREVTTVDIGDIRQQTDQIAQRHRELDTTIQEINWLTELIE